MNKLERIIDMTEHPERYADDDFCHISGNNGPISDEDIDHEWQRLMTSRRQLRHARLRWAALFIGVLFVSSLVYAFILKTAPSPSLKAESMTDSVPPAMKAEQTADESPLSLPKVSRSFENVELGQILESLKPHYQLENITYASPQLEHLRLYYQWSSDDSLEEVASQLSSFEQLNIRIVNGNSLIVE